MNLDHYLAHHSRLRLLLLLVGFMVASLALYLAVAAGFIGVPGALPNVFWDRVFPALSLVTAVAIDFCIAWLLASRSNRSFGPRFLQASAVIISGAVLTSLAVMREHWLEMMRELVRRI
jgi:hypothetical protein